MLAWKMIHDGHSSYPLTAYYFTALDVLMLSLKHGAIFYAVLHVWHCMVSDLLTAFDKCWTSFWIYYVRVDVCHAAGDAACAVDRHALGRTLRGRTAKKEDMRRW